MSKKSPMDAATDKLKEDIMVNIEIISDYLSSGFFRNGLEIKVYGLNAITLAILDRAVKAFMNILKIGPKYEENDNG